MLLDTHHEAELLLLLLQQKQHLMKALLDFPTCCWRCWRRQRQQQGLTGLRQMLADQSAEC
jgi:hypothetical protein